MTRVLPHSAVTARTRAYPCVAWRTLRARTLAQHRALRVEAGWLRALSDAALARATELWAHGGVNRVAEVLEFASDCRHDALALER